MLNRHQTPFPFNVYEWNNMFICKLLLHNKTPPPMIGLYTITVKLRSLELEWVEYYGWLELI
jgi:hypothetical protein